MNSVSEEVIQKIQTGNLKPRPRWRCILGEDIKWVIFGLSLLATFHVLALLLFMLSEFEWELSSRMEKSLWLVIFQSLPYIWFGVLLAFIVVAYYGLRYTRQGYRHRSGYLILTGLFISLAGGEMLYLTGAGKILNNFLEANLEAYGKTTYESRFWMQPKEGRLIGRVVRIDDNHWFRLQDVYGQIWKVDASQTDWEGATVKQGETVRLVGEDQNNFQFIALVGRLQGGHFNDCELLK